MCVCSCVVLEKFCAQPSFVTALTTSRNVKQTNILKNHAANGTVQMRFVIGFKKRLDMIGKWNGTKNYWV